MIQSSKFNFSNDMITLGLSEIKVGTAQTAPTGTIPTSGLTKIGKTYQDTCKLTQDPAEVTEHYEEGRSAPEVRSKKKKVPSLAFSIMDPDAQILADYVGGTATGTDGAKVWGYDGTEIVANKSILVVPEQGLEIYIPNADIEATINADMSAKGLFMVDFVVTPCAVTSGKAIYASPKK